MDRINATIPAVIAPLVRRHVEDAAFYWQQLDSSADATHLSARRAAHFGRLLEAHLEGLAIAGEAGIAPAEAGLARWRKPGEAFVCAWTAAQTDHGTTWELLWREVGRQPDTLLRGVISALGWLPESQSLSYIARWSDARAPAVQRVAALRACVLRGPHALESLSAPLNESLADADASVRAAACRAAALDCPIHQEGLARASTDPELAVRAEAAIALGGQDDALEIAEVLWRCVAEQAPRAQLATGANRALALRRLNRWVRHLAWQVPLGHPELPQVLAFLPRRTALTFVLYHADPAHWPFLVECMGDPEQARFAGWVWQTLTGYDLTAEAMVLPEPDAPDAGRGAIETLVDAGRGLPLPNADAVRTLAFEMPAGERALLGRTLTAELAFEILSERPQAVRMLAAHALRHLAPPCGIELRAPGQVQTAAIAAAQAAACA